MAVYVIRSGLFWQFVEEVTGDRATCLECVFASIWYTVAVRSLVVEL